jgi:hypothetical protein
MKFLQSEKTKETDAGGGEQTDSAGDEVF